MSREGPANVHFQGLQNRRLREVNEKQGQAWVDLHGQHQRALTHLARTIFLAAAGWITAVGVYVYMVHR